MPTNAMIRPVSDLRNSFAEISSIVHETKRPVFLTKNGYSDMVVMSMEAYEDLEFASEIYAELSAAEQEARLTDRRFSPQEVLAQARARIGAADAVQG